MISFHASALHRILACNGSTVAPPLPDDYRSESAEEGTAAHWVAQQFAAEVAGPTTFTVGQLAPNGVAIDADMIEHGQAYGDFIPSGEGSHILPPWIEADASFMLTPEIRIACRADVSWIDGNVLHLRDYKYGWRLIEVVGNWQLIAGAIGAVRKLFREWDEDLLGAFPVTEVCMSIHQPRPYHPDGPLREWTVTLTELSAWHDKLVALITALDPRALATGSHCAYCPGAILGTCPAFVRASYNAIDAVMTADMIDVPPAALAVQLDHLRRAQEVLKDRLGYVEDLVVRALQSNSASVPNYGVRPNYGNTIWTVDADTIRKETNADILQPAKLVTPAEAKRRGVSDEVIAKYTKRPMIGQKLVKIDADAEARKALEPKKQPKPRKARAAKPALTSDASSD